jgi:TPR repeat protein
MVELGLCYYSGRWVPPSQERAMELWAKAASLGSNDALVRIAITQVRVERREESLEQNLQDLDEARHAGSVLAQVALGYCYEYGIGVSRNKAEAATLYRSAAQRGSQDAFRALKRMHDEVRPSDKEFMVEE